MKLTPKQKAFAEFYAASGNATDAAIKAGYSEKTAQQIGAENLLKPVISDYLATLTKNDAENRIMSAIERQTFLTDVVRGAIKEGENSAKLSDRIRACELLGKMQGDFVEKQSIELTNHNDFRDEIIARVLAGD